MKTVTIKGHEVQLSKIHAEEGYRLLHKLGRCLGPSIGSFAEDNFKAGIELFFRNMSEDELVKTIKQLQPKIVVDGGKLNISDYSITMLAIKELLFYNFEDFFSPISDALKSMVK